MEEGDRQLLAELARHPGWGVLRRELERRKEHDKLYWGGRLIFGKENVPVEEMWRLQGWFQGAEWLLSQTDKAFNSLKEEREGG